MKKHSLIEFITQTTWVSMLGLGFSAFGATNIKDLKLECTGTYEVQSSVAYYKPPIGRAPAFAGTNEKIKVLEMSGEGCSQLTEFYNLTVNEGDILDFGVSTGESHAKALSAAYARTGKTFPFETTQSFKYKQANGILPLFPEVHEEYAHILGMSGAADAKSLYGTAPVEELSDDQILDALDIAYRQITWGKQFQHNNSWSSSDWLSLILKLTPKEVENVKEHTQDLLNVFKNIARYNSSFVTYHPGVLVGEKINALLNEYGESKWQSKLQAWQKNPMLFHGQIIGWSFIKENKTAPKLSAQEIESFLEYALEQSENLAKVSQLWEARVLLSQYKVAAKSLKTYSGAEKFKTKHFELTPKSESLIESILAVKWS